MKDQFFLRNRYIFAIDLVLIVFSVLLSFLLRLEVLQVFVDYYFTLLVMMGLALVIKPIVYRRFGLYQRFWVYASVRELVTIAMAVTTQLPKAEVTQDDTNDHNSSNKPDQIIHISLLLSVYVRRFRLNLFWI